MPTIKKINVGGVSYDIGGGLTEDVKQASLQIAEKVAYIDEHGQQYYDDLYDAFYDNTWNVTNTLSNASTSNPATKTEKDGTYTAIISANTGYTLDGATVQVTMGGANVTSVVYSNGVVNIPAVTGDVVITVVAVALTVVSISAVYTQSGEVYSTDSLDSLKADLVVTATFNDSSTGVVPSADYSLTGTLTAGTSTVTVEYEGQTATFDVEVTEFVPEYPKTIVPSTSDGCGFGTLNFAGTYPYQPNTNKNRIHFQGAEALGYPVEMGKTYTVSVNTDLTDSIQAAIISINQTGKTTIENKGTGAASMRGDTGWQTLPYVYTPLKVDNQDTALIWIVLRKSTDALFSALTDITSVVITES